MFRCCEIDERGMKVLVIRTEEVAIGRYQKLDWAALSLDVIL